MLHHQCNLFAVGQAGQRIFLQFMREVMSSAALSPGSETVRTIGLLDRPMSNPNRTISLSAQPGKTIILDEL